MARSKSAARPARAVPTAPPVTFRAGCLREWTLPCAEADLAYTEQAFPDCPACPHRVEPEGTLPFCTLRPVGAAHPFAALAGLQLPE